MFIPPQSPFPWAHRLAGSRVVLVGGGHAHVQVLAAWRRHALPGVKLSLVVDRSDAVYSGMIPGVMSGQYQAGQATIDLRALADACGAQLHLAAVERIDLKKKLLRLGGMPALPYDVASLNVGSISAGLTVPGVATHAVATRPIGDLLQRIRARVARRLSSGGGEPLHVVVAGGGAAGIELAFAIYERYREQAGLKVTLVDAGARPLASKGGRVARRIDQALALRGIGYMSQRRVVEVTAEYVVLDDASRVKTNLVLWSTGPAPPEVIRNSSLPCGKDGFILTNNLLQVKGHPNVFAVGDCATMEGQEQVPRAGVYAVRAGPVLFHNLRALLQHKPLQPFCPQQRFLSIVSYGNGRALATKGPLCVEGRLAWWLKDLIDRRWIRRFSPRGATAQGA